MIVSSPLTESPSLKYMVRSLGRDFGFRATFMPKPFAHLTGSGCHAHLSLHDAATDRNVCGDSSAAAKANHGLSRTALRVLGGALAHSPAVAALSNPTVNSYKRLQATTTASGATWSPPAVTWAGNNRTVLVRVPGGAPRMELRLGDCAANPYLLAAAAGAAGLVGLANGSVPPIPADLNMYDHTNPAVEAAVGASGVVLPSTWLKLSMLSMPRMHFAVHSVTLCGCVLSFDANTGGNTPPTRHPCPCLSRFISACSRPSGFRARARRGVTARETRDHRPLTSRQDHPTRRPHIHLTAMLSKCRSAEINPSPIHNHMPTDAKRPSPYDTRTAPAELRTKAPNLTELALHLRWTQQKDVFTSRPQTPPIGLRKTGAKAADR